MFLPYLTHYKQKIFLDEEDRDEADHYHYKKNTGKLSISSSPDNNRQMNYKLCHWWIFLKLGGGGGVNHPPIFPSPFRKCLSPLKCHFTLLAHLVCHFLPLLRHEERHIHNVAWLAYHLQPPPLSCGKKKMRPLITPYLCKLYCSCS